MLSSFFVGGSLFVVFRRALPETKNGEAKTNFPGYTPLVTIDGPWDVRFDPKWGGPGWAKFDKLMTWTSRTEEGIKFYSGIGSYRTTFNFPGNPKGQKLFPDLGVLLDVGIARVRLNGTDLGVTWAPPFRVEITEVLRQRENQLEVEVANSGVTVWSATGTGAKPCVSRRPTSQLGRIGNCSIPECLARFK